MRSSNKNLTQLMQEAKTQGWTIERRKNGHLKWVSPMGYVVFTSFTPSDPRAINNVIQDLRVGGFIHIKKGK
jgi:hypothetical protein